MNYSNQLSEFGDYFPILKLNDLAWDQKQHSKWQETEKIKGGKTDWLAKTVVWIE